MSDICVVIVGILLFAIPIQILIFLIRWIMGKSKKGLGIAILVSLACFVVFTLIGALSWDGAAESSKKPEPTIETMVTVPPSTETKATESESTEPPVTEPAKVKPESAAPSAGAGATMSGRTETFEFPKNTVAGAPYTSTSMTDVAKLNAIATANAPENAVLFGWLVDRGFSMEVVSLGSLEELLHSVYDEAADFELTLTPLYQKTKETPTEPPTEPSEEITYISDVSFNEIYRAYRKNELSADDVYKGNRYRVTATINGISAGGLFNITGGATLTMQTRVDNTIVFFLAEFEKKQESALKMVEVGDTITFEGTCSSEGYWYDCELIR